MNPQNHFTFPRSLAAVSFVNLSIHLVAVLVWCAFCGAAIGQTPQLTVNNYYQDDGHGNCIAWGGSDTACGNLAVTVSDDAMPGDYTYDLLCNPNIIRDGGNYLPISCATR